MTACCCEQTTVYRHLHMTGGSRKGANEELRKTARNIPRHHKRVTMPILCRPSIYIYLNISESSRSKCFGVSVIVNHKSYWKHKIWAIWSHFKAESWGWPKRFVPTVPVFRCFQVLQYLMWQLVHTTSNYCIGHWSVGDFDLGGSKQTWSHLSSLILLFLGINSIDRADVHRLNSEQ
jgi:hypothetical protein